MIIELASTRQYHNYPEEYISAVIITYVYLRQE